MPVNDRYPIADILAATERYYEQRRRMVFIEYVMLAGVNDTHVQARQLARLLDPRKYKVNLIPYNPTGFYDGSSRGAIAAFKAVLEEHGLRATVRLTRGRDIDAACGQLARGRADAAARRTPRRSAAAARALLARAQQPVAQRGLLLGRGSHCPGSGRSSTDLRPNSLRNSGVVRYRTAPNCERPDSSISPRSTSALAADSDATPRMRATSGRETGCR